MNTESLENDLQIILVISQNGLHLFAGFDFNFCFAGIQGQVS